eukprot:CAMPEP_0119089200 /NCGR_PEP_ID=MMETSP1178-20130426/148207_1 /TAXON_ID=33656 /ORGANISM="unid sp, Strain CCMP2000" /LENGTH=248 /DNA_ID=CAMNT_0007072533 /DNA_START=119 /DNA_END=865 /DNA_ORIENTATION=-
MSLSDEEVDTLMPPAGNEFYKVPAVGDAAEEVARLLDEDREAQVAKLFAPPAEDAYLDERTELVGEIGSAELLNRDEEAGFWPPELSTDRDAPAMLWVDEYSCIGCRWCACVARNTFKVSDEYGTAMVMQQGGDQADVIEEAIDVCPSDCIHRCSRSELEVLEKYRDLYQGDMMAKYYHGRRMVGEGSGGGAGAAPNWRDPLVHTSWHQGSKFVKTERLKAGLDDVLIHKPGTKTNFVAWAKEPREVD